MPAKQFLCLQEYTPAAILWLFTGDRRYFKPDEDNVAADFFDLAPGDNEFLAVGKQVGITPRTVLISSSTSLTYPIRSPVQTLMTSLH